MRGSLALSLNLATRTLAMQHITSRLLHALERGERVLVGWDFGFGYPAGTAAALGGDWQGVWSLLADRLVDGDDNANNRFEVAEALNRQLGAPLFWGHPPGRSYAGLMPTRPLHGYSAIAERRAVERIAGGVQPMWKLSGVGAVGSQSLTGIARLETLRRRPELADAIAVWPFETGFAGVGERPISMVEMYPSLFPLGPDAPEPKDRAQVEAAVAGFAALDAAGRLATFLTPPGSVSEDVRAVAVREEGWIAGAGQRAMLEAIA